MNLDAVNSNLDANRGYAYHSDHSVPPLVSWEAYRLILTLLDRYGRYDWHGYLTRFVPRTQSV